MSLTGVAKMRDDGYVIASLREQSLGWARGEFLIDGFVDRERDGEDR